MQKWTWHLMIASPFFYCPSFCFIWCLIHHRFPLLSYFAISLCIYAHEYSSENMLIVNMIKYVCEKLWFQKTLLKYVGYDRTYDHSKLKTYKQIICQCLSVKLLLTIHWTRIHCIVGFSIMAENVIWRRIIEYSNNLFNFIYAHQNILLAS